MHDHDHGQSGDFLHRAFGLGIVFNTAFVVVEAIVGFASGSLALVGDAGHNLSDVISLCLAWGAIAVARRRPSSRHTYGFRKATVLAALVGSILLLVVLGGLAWEAIDRLAQPPDVDGMVLIVVAAIGVVINTATALLFMRHQRGDLNVRSAYLHMAADAAVSGGVVVAGLLIMVTGWGWLDSAVTLSIVAVVLIGTLALFRDSLALAMDAVPKQIDPAAVEGYLAAQPGVVEVHDLHIWGMSTREAALTVHLVVPADCDAGDGFLHAVTCGLHEHFGIEHSTVQIERDPRSHPCVLAMPERV